MGLKVSFLKRMQIESFSFTTGQGIPLDAYLRSMSMLFSYPLLSRKNISIVVKALTINRLAVKKY